MLRMNLLALRRTPDAISAREIAVGLVASEVGLPASGETDIWRRTSGSGECGGGCLHREEHANMWHRGWGTYGLSSAVSACIRGGRSIAADRSESGTA